MGASTRLALGALLWSSIACTAKEVPPVDSAAVAEGPPMAVDTVKPMDSAAAKKSGSTPRDSIIGYDSAFGPVGEIDATGKVTPIRKRPEPQKRY